MSISDSLNSTVLLAAGDMLGWVASALSGTALAVFIWWILNALSTDELEQGDQWRFDVSRINHLRKIDGMFRVFQPLIQFLSKFMRSANRDSLPLVQREIQVAGLTRYWLPEEYLAKLLLISLLLFPIYLTMGIQWFGINGPLPALVLTGVSYWFLRRRLTGMARQRLTEIKRRMPFLLDLLTLLMESGSSFLQALHQAVNEFSGHPVATEFGRVLTDMNMGKARTEAFDNMRERLDDDEITAIVGAIIQSERLGSPVTHVFRTQADVLQVKRSQRAETIAGEAGVNMLFPGILVMASTVLIILGPFMMDLLKTGIDF